MFNLISQGLSSGGQATLSLVKYGCYGAVAALAVKNIGLTAGAVSCRLSSEVINLIQTKTMLINPTDTTALNLKLKSERCITLLKSTILQDLQLAVILTVAGSIAGSIQGKLFSNAYDGNGNSPDHDIKPIIPNHPNNASKTHSAQTDDALETCFAFDDFETCPAFTAQTFKSLETCPAFTAQTFKSFETGSAFTAQTFKSFETGSAYPIFTPDYSTSNSSIIMDTTSRNPQCSLFQSDSFYTDVNQNLNRTVNQDESDLFNQTLNSKNTVIEKKETVEDTSSLLASTLPTAEEVRDLESYNFYFTQQTQNNKIIQHDQISILRPVLPTPTGNPIPDDELNNYSPSQQKTEKLSDAEQFKKRETLSAEQRLKEFLKNL